MPRPGEALKKADVLGRRAGARGDVGEGVGGRLGRRGHGRSKQHVLNRRTVHQTGVMVPVHQGRMRVGMGMLGWAGGEGESES